MTLYAPAGLLPSEREMKGLVRCIPSVRGRDEDEMRGGVRRQQKIREKTLKKRQNAGDKWLCRYRLKESPQKRKREWGREEYWREGESEAERHEGNQNGKWKMEGWKMRREWRPGFAWFRAAVNAKQRDS